MSDIPFEFDLSCGDSNNFDITAAVIASGVDFSKLATKTYIAEELAAAGASATVYTSQLINDSGFITSHQSLSNYYTKSETDTAVNKAKTTVVQTLKSGTEIGSVNGTKLYAPDGSSSGGDGSYVKKSEVVSNMTSGTAIATIGGVTLYVPMSSSGGVDLSNYYTKTQCDNTFLKKSDAGGSGGVCVFG